MASRIVLHNRLGEIAQQYLRKGSKVYIEGSLQVRVSGDSQNGQERYTTEIRGDQMQMLDSSNRGQSDAHGGFAQPRFNNNQAPATGYANQNQGGFNQNQGGGYANNNPSGFAPKPQAAPATAPADLDDDLPF